jgi:PE-PPE domain/PE family
MSYVIAAPEIMTLAATDLADIGSVLTAAKAAAAAPTTGIVVAAQDEVSAAIAAAFSAHGQGFQALGAQAAAFHEQFVQVLAAVGNAYAETEAAAAGALGALTGPARALLAPLTGGAASVVAATKAAFADAPPTPVAVSLIMDMTGMPVPPQQYINEVYRLYISPNFTTANLQGLTTPEQFFPLTGLKSMTYHQSVSQGLTILNNAIMQAYKDGITPINVLGYSQSTVIASLEMPKLLAAGVPSTDVNFVLLGDPMNPNGGFSARLTGLTTPIPGGATFFHGTTPANDYPTVIYSREYDPAADFPRYPIDLLADLNAFMGFPVHYGYPTLTATQVASAIELPTSGPTMTTYYMIPTQNLPLLEPLRAIPYIGNPLADLLQPDLTYLVNWGYGDPAYGYSTGPANVTTPFGFLPPLAATTALGPDLVSGTQQGIAAAISDFHAAGLPSLSSLSLSGMSTW